MRLTSNKPSTISVELRTYFSYSPLLWCSCLTLKFYRRGSTVSSASWEGRERKRRTGDGLCRHRVRTSCGQPVLWANRLFNNNNNNHYLVSTSTLNVQLQVVSARRAPCCLRLASVVQRASRSLVASQCYIHRVRRCRTSRRLPCSLTRRLNHSVRNVYR
ncbi:hypothetical protein BDZ89DRAFT_540152 [Hymenopellis radicata]|nr:hypothetical protein BDZ89DRAFT_540152 [Hymenopellis radicata]